MAEKVGAKTFEELTDFVFREMNRISGSPVNSSLRSELITAHQLAVHDAEVALAREVLSIIRYLGEPLNIKPLTNKMMEIIRDDGTC
jgi:hypothetical protein